MRRCRPVALPLLALTLTLTLTACDEPTGPERLLITVAVSPDKIVPGDTATIVVRFSNLSTRPVHLQLNCTRLFEVANAEGDVIAGREPLICLAVVVPPVVLGPFGSLERRMAWTGQSRRWISGTFVTEPFPPGPYRVYGKLGEARSAPDNLELQTP